MNEAGEVDGLVNNGRLLLQGQRFWQDQMREVNEALEWELTEPQRRAEGYRLEAELSAEMRRLDADYYPQHPELRPTPGELKAQALREMADRIEEREFDRMMEPLRLQEIGRPRAFVTRACRNRNPGAGPGFRDVVAGA
ncbi:MAG: hypothetical protein U1F09_04640 [Steroidobacteraceae bacterium]